MKQYLKYIALAAGAAGGMAITSAKADNTNYADGDLLFYVQQLGGTNTVMVPLGAAFGYRNKSTNSLNLVDLGSILSTTYGNSWFSDGTLYFGIAGVRSASTNTTTQVNGDPNRTMYVTANRAGLGTVGSANSAAWSGLAVSDMTNGSSGILTMTGIYDTQFTSLIAVSPNTSSQVDDQNPFLGSNPGTAFSVFPGGVEAEVGTGATGNFGGLNGVVGAVDLYRILATNSAAGQVTGTLRGGDYEGTFVLDNTGKVSYVVQPVPEPSSAILLGSTLLLGGFVRRRKSNA